MKFRYITSKDTQEVQHTLKSPKVVPSYLNLQYVKFKDDFKIVSKLPCSVGHLVFESGANVNNILCAVNQIKFVS